MNPTRHSSTLATAGFVALAGLLFLGPALPELTAQTRASPQTISQVDMVAARLRSTPQWKPYQQSCQPTMINLRRWASDRLNTYSRAPGMFQGVPPKVRLVMLIGSTGRVAKVICEPKSEFSTDLASRAATLQFPPPPSPGWPLGLTMRPRFVGRHTGRGGQDIGYGH